VDLRALQRRWDAFARRDPFGAILDPLQGTGERDLDAFFAWGDHEIDAVLIEWRRVGLPVEYGSALDFGCGAGRLTQAMARHFSRCEGVDISPAMIKLANELNRHGEHCRYTVNNTDSLVAFADRNFDFVYSSLVLQHMDAAFARGYLVELVRVLRPGGLLVFQLPSERDTSSELPWSAFRARIESLSSGLRLVPGQVSTIGVLVGNAGDFTWPSGLARRPVVLGNHWLDGKGRVLMQDDARAPLPHSVDPGESVELSLAVAAPSLPGEYILELDLVQEGVAWFAERGSRPARLAVRIEGGSAAALPPAKSSRPRRTTLSGPAARARVLRGRFRRAIARRLRTPVEMNAVPRAEVLELLSAAGARALRVVENDAAGSGWISLQYAATKDQTG
jgi:SAM-dependent methyltransferase